MKICENHANLRKTMKVLGGQEASLGSSKGFYKGSRSLLTVLSVRAPKYMKIHENP